MVVIATAERKRGIRMDIKSLLSKIEKAANYSYARDDYLRLNDKDKALLNKIIYEWVAEQTTEVDLTRKVATLEAKVYTYEKIIANSNFAPILDRPTPSVPMDTTMEEVIKAFGPGKDDKFVRREE